MPVFAIVMLIILAALVALLIFLYFWGKKLQKRQDESREKMEETKQSVQMLVIDKKMLPIKSSGLPQAAIDQTPKYLRRSKLPIVKARCQGKIMTFIADSNIYPVIPVKKEVKATISGLYIMDVRAIRGQLEQPPKKKKWYQKLSRKADEAPSLQKQKEKRDNLPSAGRRADSRYDAYLLFFYDFTAPAECCSVSR